MWHLIAERAQRCENTKWRRVIKQCTSGTAQPAEPTCDARSPQNSRKTELVISCTGEHTPCVQPSAAFVHGTVRSAIQHSRSNRNQQEKKNQNTTSFLLVYGMGLGKSFIHRISSNVFLAFCWCQWENCTHRRSRHTHILPPFWDTMPCTRATIKKKSRVHFCLLKVGVQSSVSMTALCQSYSWVSPVCDPVLADDAGT